MEKRRNCFLGAISPLFHNIFLPVVKFSCLGRTRFSLRDKRLFEISEVEITRVSCIHMDHLNLKENVGCRELQKCMKYAMKIIISRLSLTNVLVRVFLF